MRVVVALIAGAAGLALPSAALACAAPYVCPEIFPAEGASVPANTPAFFVEGCSWSECATEDEPRLELSDGSPVEVRLSSYDDGIRSGWLVTPAGPLAAGSYVLHSPIETACDTSAGRTNDTYHTFEILAQAAPLPDSIPALDVADVGVGLRRVGTVSGMCTSEEEAAYVSLAFTPAGPVAAFTEVIDYRWYVDGQAWDSVWGNGTSPSITLDRLCGTPDDPGAYSTLGPGSHEVRLAVQLFGAPIDCSTAVDVELRCDGEGPIVSAPRTTCGETGSGGAGGGDGGAGSAGSGGSGNDGGGGAVGGGGGTADEPATPVGDDSCGVDDPDSEEEESGCTAGPGAPSLLALGLASIALRLGRRPRS